MERGESIGTTTGASSGGTTRYEAYTEAVPLNLSCMAHNNYPLSNGVLDGIRQVLQHTLLQCVNYARIVYPPHQWGFRDVVTSEFAWAAYMRELNVSDLPLALQRLDFRHQYSRNAFIYLKTAIPADLTREKELDFVDGWSHQAGILGRVTLSYISTELLTPEELDGTEVEDAPPCLLYRVDVEYRSLPATGNKHATEAEELSMLSFGGSVDDDVKYGALASLYDEHAMYVLEIYSVRGKKYKFDLMHSTLANGDVPRLPTNRGGSPDAAFVKSLCVTVRDHSEQQARNSNGEYAITRMSLSVEGKLRHHVNDLPPFGYMTNAIVSSFLRLNPNPPAMIAASPSGQTLLLDPELAGHIYVNGRFVAMWGDDPRAGTHGLALFGMDLHSLPFWNGQIVNYEKLKESYAQLWQEVLVDARLLHLNLAKKLLFRLMTGEDPDASGEDDLYDDDCVDPLVHEDSLESILLADTRYDPVGISAKALATRFAMDLGRDAFPCLPHETQWVHKMLPHREPLVVPQRLINVLRRGGYFDTQKTSDELWFAENRTPNEGMELTIIDAAVQLLLASGCDSVDAGNIVVVSIPGVDGIIAKDFVCRWNAELEQFVIHEGFFTAPVDEYLSHDTDSIRIKGYLLGMYIAKAHPFGKVLARYLIRNNFA